MAMPFIEEGCQKKNEGNLTAKLSWTNKMSTRMAV